MASYPTFAFFAQRPALRAVADALGESLGARLPHARAEDRSGVEVGPEAEPDSVVFSGEHSSVEVSLFDEAVVLVELSDFPSELYDRDAVTPADVAAKREIALDVNRVLLELGAELTYTSRFDDRGDSDHVGRADRLAAGRAAAPIGEEPSYYWLVGGSGAPPHSSFEQVGVRVYENREALPLFMTMV